MICHQRLVRNNAASKEGSLELSLSQCRVEEINRAQAAEIILRYEWLRSMPQVGVAYYGLVAPGEGVIGAVCFGMGPSKKAREFCGEDNAHRVICLERGACAPMKPANGHADNAASFLISRACKLARKQHGWGAFFAYSDAEAGEIGTVYQASNWLFLGQSTRRGETRKLYFSPDGERFTSRRLRAAMKRAKFDGTLKEYFPQVLEPAGWTRIDHQEKRKYVLILDKRLRKELIYQPRPYPKRDAHTLGAACADWSVNPSPPYSKITKRARRHMEMLLTEEDQVQL